MHLGIPEALLSHVTFPTIIPSSFFKVSSRLVGKGVLSYLKGM